MVCFTILSANYSEAIRVFTMQELEEKIATSEVQDIFLTDTGIEGFYNHEGVRSPFIVFGEFDKIPEHIIQLGSKYGVNIIQTMPKREKSFTKMIDLRNIYSFVYLAISLLALIYLIFINRKLVKIVSILSRVEKIVQTQKE